MSESEITLLNSPYGEVKYELFRQLRRAYADKSGIIKFLDDISMTRYPVLLRPRRFGKSTFVPRVFDFEYPKMVSFSRTDLYF